MGADLDLEGFTAGVNFGHHGLDLPPVRQGLFRQLPVLPGQEGRDFFGLQFLDRAPEGTPLGELPQAFVHGPSGLGLQVDVYRGIDLKPFIIQPVLAVLLL